MPKTLDQFEDEDVERRAQRMIANLKPRLSLGPLKHIGADGVVRSIYCPCGKTPTRQGKDGIWRCIDCHDREGAE